MYKKWFIANQKCNQHSIVLLKEIILISWSVNVAAEDRHYSNSLSVTKEGSIYVVKYKKEFNRKFQKGNFVTYSQNFLIVKSLVNSAESLTLSFWSQ